MNEAESEPWYHLYASAVVELDPKRFLERVNEAEPSIHGRRRELQYDSDHHEERQLMEDAQHALEGLRRCPQNDESLGPTNAKE